MLVLLHHTGFFGCRDTVGADVVLKDLPYLTQGRHFSGCFKQVLLHQVHDATATHVVTMHIPISILFCEFRLMTMVCVPLLILGQALEELPRFSIPVPAGNRQRNGCFYLVEIDFHTIGGWLDGFYNIFWKKVSDCFLMLWFCFRKRARCTSWPSLINGRWVAFPFVK